MMPYILNVGLILSGCIVFYKLLLQKETFYKVNRWVLISCLILSFTIPLVPMPQQWSLQKAKETVIVSNQVFETSEQSKLTPENSTNTSSTSTPLINAIDDSSTGTKISNPISFQKLLSYVIYLYWFGVIAFSISFLLQLIILLVRAYKNPVILDVRFRIVEMSVAKPLCSFTNKIFINH